MEIFCAPSRTNASSYVLILLSLLWLRARVCSLRGSCVALCLLSRCRLCLVMLGVAHFRSAPLGVLRPKPRWGRAWSPIWFFFHYTVFPKTPPYLTDRIPSSEPVHGPSKRSCRSGRSADTFEPCLRPRSKLSERTDPFLLCACGIHAAAVPQVALSSLWFPQTWYSPSALHVTHILCHNRLQEQG
jgi:hypothetical protein